jgi:hypothetical protein
MASFVPNMGCGNFYKQLGLNPVAEADRLSNFTLVEGAPLFDYHVTELARITDQKG